MVNMEGTIIETRLGNLPVRRGKVRDVYDLGDELLLLATDRISAYDVVLPTPIPGKGILLTQISAFWFRLLAERVPTHFIEVVEDHAPTGLEPYLAQMRRRATRCRKCEVVPIECVVRGYLAGSAWEEYRRSGSVCGLILPTGLKQCEKLPEPIFTPATKAEVGHDLNITFEEACDRVGRPVMTLLRQRSLEVYRFAADYAARRGIIIADTKFEWGRSKRRNAPPRRTDCTEKSGDPCADTSSKEGPPADEFLLIDEVLTPDSSRFWPADRYAPGRDQESFDKQYLRNYLTDLVRQGRWNKHPPGPPLPEEIVRNTLTRYLEAAHRLAG